MLADTNTCYRCSRDMTLQESLQASIDESRDWLVTHPYSNGSWPSLNNVKQMLTEGCDFASILLYCMDAGLVTPAYANFRCLLERLHYAIYFATVSEGAEWEHHGMSKTQQELHRFSQRYEVSTEDSEWLKGRLAGIRQWNRQPTRSDKEKPTTMRKPKAYSFDPGPRHPAMEGWYERCSAFVHPTYSTSANVGRRFQDNEIKVATGTAHVYLCSIALIARLLEEKTGQVSY